MAYHLIPDFILEKYSRKERSGQLYATALFVDISGFSVLTDQLMAHGQHGAEVLAGVMGATFEPLIEAVYGQGGFVTVFAGDAFTAVFPHTDPLASRRALAAAVAIQAHMGARPEQETYYGRYTISARVGVASGEVIWGIVAAEDDRRACYYFRGAAIDGCAAAEQMAQSGEVILDGVTYQAVSNDVVVDPLDSNFRLTEVIGSLPEPQMDRHTFVNQEQLLHFVPPEVVQAGQTGEFRQVVNVFISLPTVRTEAQLDMFMQTVFVLQDQYGGLLSRLDFGDKGANVLMFWGAPTAHENDIQRALNFILELQTQTAIPINGGITYRIAHAGYFGSSRRGEYTCYGRGINLAARFMSAAPRGEIWVDRHIAQRAGGQFDLEFEGQQTFKGFADPQKVYILFEHKDVNDDFYEGHLIGREADLTCLAEFIAPIFNGQSPGMFVVWGEPGAGKSRLVYEFLTHHLQSEPKVKVFFAQTDEILRQSLNPFVYWMKRYFGYSQGLAESRNKRNFNRKLDELIAETQAQPLADELDRVRSFLGALIGLYWPDSLYAQVDAKERQEHTFTALAALLKAESSRQPAVLLLEDAHWLDQDSTSFLSTFLTDLAQPGAEQFPVAILVTARSDGGQSGLAGAPHQELNLSVLDPSDLSALSQSYLGAPAADDLLTLLVERSQGNPFFAEQILRYLVDGRQLEQVNGLMQLISSEQSPLPGDVNALLVARLDSLAPGVREIVQTAAVLGREFELRVLSQMLPGDPYLPRNISIAEQESIWSGITEDRYIFKHALLRDAAYRMQLRARRRSLHQLAFEAFETLYQEDLSSRFGELAYHALAAGLQEPAFRYSLLAGNQAMEKYAAAEAVDHYRPAMDLLGQVETSSQQRRQLCTLYGRALELTGDPAAALAHYEVMAGLAKELGDHELELESLVAQGTLRSTGNVVSDFELAESLGQTGLSLALALQDRAAEAKILWNLTNVYRLTGRYEASLDRGLQAFELAEVLNLREQMAFIANDLSRAYMGLGRVSEMVANSKRTVALWREVQNQPMLIDGLANYGMALAMTGHFEQALTVAEEGVALSQDSNNLWGEAFMRYTPVLVHLQRLEIEAGLEHASVALRLAQSSGATIVQFYMGLFQFLLHLAANDYPQAAFSAQQALAIASQHFKFQRPAASAALAMASIELGDMDSADELANSYQVNPDQLGMLLLLLPELGRCRYLFARGSYADLLAISKKVTEFAKNQGISFLIPQFYLVQGQAQLALDDRSAARETLQSGLTLLHQTGGRWGISELSNLMDKIG